MHEHTPSLHFYPGEHTTAVTEVGFWSVCHVITQAKKTSSSNPSVSYTHARPTGGCGFVVLFSLAAQHAAPHHYKIPSPILRRGRWQEHPSLSQPITTGLTSGRTLTCWVRSSSLSNSCRASSVSPFSA